MTEERITTNQVGSHARPTTTNTTVIRNGEPRGGGTWLIAILALIAIIAAIYLFTQTSSSEIGKDNAITEAANEVGDAANSVGTAAQDAGKAVENAAKNVGE